jgi:hypothetical protein
MRPERQRIEGVYVRRAAAGKDGDSHLNLFKDYLIEAAASHQHARSLFAIINKGFPDCTPV